MSGGWAVAIACGTLLTACGGSSSGESRDDGGIAGAGGTGPAPQGSLYIEIGAAIDPPIGTQCPSVGHTANVGVPPPTASNPGQRVDIGGCTVSGDGAFNGEISQGTISFTMFGQATQGGTGKGSLVYYDDKLGTTMESASDGCEVFVNEGSLQVAAGRIWAKFSCPQIIEAPSYYCKASGVFVLENCKE